MLKKINLKMILCGVAALFGLVAFFMIFAPAVKDKLFGEGVSGLKVAFGNEDDGLAVSAYMLPMFLTIIGVALVVVSAFGKGGKVVPIVAAVCFVGAAIVFFLAPNLATLDLGEIPEGYEEEAKEMQKAFRKGIELAPGAIVGGIFSIIAAVVSVVPVFVCKDNG